MRKSKLRKGLVLGIIVLFVGANVIPSMGVVEKSTKLTIARGILYVGGSGPGNYSTIQEAIDDASDGDTVFVYNGKYYEDVTVNKQIIPIGKDRNITIINSGGSDNDANLSDGENVSFSSYKNSAPEIGAKKSFYSALETDINYYVSNNGADSNSGTSTDNPWKTISKVNSELNGGVINQGDDIYFKKGDTFNDAQLQINTGGTSTNDMVFGAYGIGAKPIFNYDSSSVIYCNYAVDNVTFENLNISENSANIAINFDSGCEPSDIIFRNCDIFKIENCHFEPNSADGYGIAITSSNTYSSLSVGNYRSSYIGVDKKYGSNQDIPGSDSISDTPHSFIGELVNYHLVQPCEKELQYDIYVDDDAEPGWYDATHVKTVQEGIDNASGGDTVYVFNGTYYENVVVDKTNAVVNKTIQLIGESRDGTIIDGGESGDVVRIKDDRVKISGFTIQNSGSGGFAGIYVNSNFNTIFFNNFSNNDDGIEMDESMDNTISNNIFFSNNWDGLDLWRSSNNLISGNVFTLGNKNGMEMWGSSNDNFIFGNTITSNQNVGIVLMSSSNNNVSGNSVSNNYHGIGFWCASNNIIYCNNITSNNHNGIDILQSFPSHSDNNLIYHNNFISNNQKNAYDECNNTWDNGYPSGGNYWDDYTGVDNDGDGIGDTPYSISGGSNQDLYPLIQPGDNISPLAYFIYSPSFPTDLDVIEFNDISCDPDGTIVNHTWDLDDGNISYAKNPTHGYAVEGTYNITLTVTDDDGANDTTWRLIRVTHARLTADFIWTPIFPTTDDTIQFNDKSVNPYGSIVNWSWDFDDCNISYEQNPTHKYLEIGRYNVSLTVTDGNGTNDTITRQITIIPTLVYIDDDYDSSTYGWNTTHFDVIQDGIDAVAENGIVIVHNGTYYENVIVDKTINLSGEDRNSTIINAGGVDNAIEIDANWVNISGFTTQGSGSESNDAGIWLSSYKSNNIITGNKVSSNNGDGIELNRDCNNNTISNNIATSNNYRGITLFDNDDNNTITDNIVSNNRGGISLYYYNDNNIISGNNVSYNEYGGIQLWVMNNNIISDNTITLNNDFGIYLEDSINNTIISNIISNGYNGVYLWDSINSTITGNTIHSNNYSGIYLEYFSSSNTICGNTISNNDNKGIYTGDYDYDGVSNNNNIFHNNFINNTQNAYDVFSNFWDDGYPSGGNYWDDYIGDDNYHGPNQDIPGSDGIGDIPYLIPGGSNQDKYPLYPLTPVTEVIIDIKPGGYPNSINPKSKGKVPVAILTTDDFDASTVDTSTVVFLDASPVKWAIEDVDDDGDDDMLFHFKTQELDFTLLVDEGGEYPYAYLTGETSDAQPFEGKDTVRLVHPLQMLFDNFFARVLQFIECIVQTFT